MAGLVAEVYSASRGELAWDTLAARMARLSGARALWILRGERVVGRFGSGEPAPVLADPASARQRGYRVDSHPSRQGAAPSRLVQHFAAPATANGCLDPLLTHVNRVLDLQDRDDRFGGLHRELTRTLSDRMPVAVFEIEPDFRVRSTNASARELTSAGDRIWLRNGVLGFEAEGTRARLRDRMKSGDAQYITLLDSGEHEGALALCLRSNDTGTWWLSALDPGRPPRPSLTELRRRYGLSERESRLALEIACGASIPDAAERLGVSQGTLRSQLKSVFRKTTTRSQSELVIRLREDPTWFLKPELDEAILE